MMPCKKVVKQQFFRGQGPQARILNHSENLVHPTCTSFEFVRQRMRIDLHSIWQIANISYLTEVSVLRMRLRKFLETGVPKSVNI